MTDTELSQLTHEFDMWKVHQSEIDSEVQHIPMDEKIFLTMTLSFLNLLSTQYLLMIMKL